MEDEKTFLFSKNSPKLGGDITISIKVGIIRKPARTIGGEHFAETTYWGDETRVSLPDGDILAAKYNQGIDTLIKAFLKPDGKEISIAIDVTQVREYIRATNKRRLAEAQANEDPNESEYERWKESHDL